MMRSLKKMLKESYLSTFGDIDHLKPQVNLSKSWYGTTYGGFYVLPHLLSSDSVAYSFGIGKDMSLDRALIEAHGCRVYGFDPTPDSIAWVAKQPSNDRWTFLPVGIGSRTETTTFFLPANPDHVSGSVVAHENVDGARHVEVELMSFADILVRYAHRSVDLVKVDIEGSEYEIIADLLRTSPPIGQLLIEFHDRFFDTPEPRSKSATRLLAKAGYHIFGAAAGFEEISFVHESYLPR